jgi:Protein of unknown function (DUF4238)
VRSNAKRNHHYIWSHHLGRWAASGNAVHYVTTKGKLACDSVVGLARETDFYRGRHLSARQVALIRLTIAKCDASIRQFHERNLDNWLRGQRLFEFSDASGLSHMEELRAEKELFECNFIEDMHARIEHGAQGTFKAIVAQDYSVIEDDVEFSKLVCYVGHLAFRTQRFRRAIEASTSAKMLPQDAEDLSACRWFLDFLHGMNVGHSLYTHRNMTTQALLRTDASHPFILSDQPAINIHPSVKYDGSPPQHLDLFVPLTPLVALAICDSNQFSKGLQDLSPTEVDDLNRLQAGLARQTIFASDRATLKRYWQLIGSV